MQALPIERAHCSDFDEVCIDDLYLQLKANPQPITPLIFNFKAPNERASERKPYDRLKSDAVIALALLHHLILREGMRIERVLTRLEQFTSRYLVVEFMPMGLWDGKTTRPMPHWYTTDWFRSHLAHRFTILSEEVLEENRILFIAQRKDRR